MADRLRTDVKHLTGGCQCGAVRFAVNEIVDDAHLCHCRMCQKAVGNFFAALVSVDRSEIQWRSRSPTYWQSSDHVRRGFCQNCGTPLCYDDKQSNRIGLMIGTFDHPSMIALRSQEGVEGRMNWFPSIDGVAEGGITERSDRTEWAAHIRQSTRQHPDHDTLDFFVSR